MITLLKDLNMAKEKDNILEQKVLETQAEIDMLNDSLLESRIKTELAEKINDKMTKLIILKSNEIHQLKLEVMSIFFNIY